MKFNKNEFGWKEKVSINTDELVTKNDIPHYNETLMFEISSDDYRFFMNNNYFNMNALNIDETKSYIVKNKFDINDDEEYTFEFIYNKENDVLINEDNQLHIYNHKSYNGTNLIEDVNSAVLTNNNNITPMTISEYDGYFRLYEVDKLELDNNCLPDNVSIKNSLTVGNRIGDIGECSVAEGFENTASGNASHAEGDGTTASGYCSHTEGLSTTASGNYSHTEGRGTEASGSGSHAEGNKTISLGNNSHIEGEASNLATDIIQDLSSSTSNDDILTAWNENSFSLAKGNGSHVEGKDNLALGDYSHAEGNYTIAIGVASHVEGLVSRADGGYSHAEGNGTTADGMCSHAEGDNTIASSENQHVQGKYNIEDTENKYAHIVGNGKYNYNTDEKVRSNAHTLDWNGNGWYAGKLTQEGTPTEDKDLATKKYVDDTKFSKNYEDLNNEPFTFLPIKLTETIGSNGTITAYCDVFDLELGHRYVGDFTKYNGICLYTFNSDNTKNTLVATTAYLSTGRNGMITIMSSSATKREILWMSAFGSEQFKVTKNSDGTFTITNSLIVPRVTNTKEFTPTSNYHLVHKKYVDDAIANQPQISFNENGELVVTINGVSKTFVPKQ